ncbi:MAG: hypothetical protein NT062_36025 [Proteobacteria bacterium]|nr:hypothetical protein [Pseudomonadota bacterium]
MAERRIRPNREHDDAELAHVDSFALASELVRRGAIAKPTTSSTHGIARITLPVLEPEGDRPTVRSACPVERPCPWVRCRAHLWRVDPDDRAGRRRVGGGDPMPLVAVTSAWSCAFDVIEAHPAGLLADDVGDVLGVVGERVGQLERKALAELGADMRELYGLESATIEREGRLRDRRKASGADRPEAAVGLTPDERRRTSVIAGGTDGRAVRRQRRIDRRAAVVAASDRATVEVGAVEPGADGITR